MPPVHMYQDDCKDAAEVLARAKAARARLRAAKPMPARRAKLIELFARPLPSAVTASKEEPAAPAPPIIEPLDMPDAPVPVPRTAISVIRAAAAHFGIRRADIIGERKTWPLVRYRQIAMYVAQKMTGRSYPDLGRSFGYRDHTTILHGVRVIERYVEARQEEVIAHIGAITDRLGMPFVIIDDEEVSEVKLPPFLKVRSRRFWTDSEDEMLRRLYGEKRLSANDTAKIIGRPRGGIYMRALAIGITAETRGRRPKAIP